jgi:hypothetical protein
MATDDENAKDKPDKQLTFLFDTAEGYRVVAANGIWGGLTVRGDFQFDFIVDYTTPPDQVVNDISGGDLTVEQSRFPPDRTVTRMRQVGVLLSISNAESVARFILEKVKTVKEAAKKAEAAKKEKDGSTSVTH